MPERDSTECPACHGRLYPKLLGCADCGLEVSTRYRGNEFSELDNDDLHLLRIFVACEGRIRDMEAALGVSYPTVKARLAGLRERLGLPADARDNAREKTREDAREKTREDAREKTREDAREPTSANEILDQLADGSISYDEALPKIRALRNKT